MTSKPPSTTYDFVVIGGGIFGVYAALHLARCGRRGVLIEQESQIFSRASLVNQARLHGGYHYPRSVATAQMSHEHQARFTHDHRDFIRFEYRKYYGIARYGSLTDSQQFQRFCDFIGAPYAAVAVGKPFNPQRLSALFETTEYSFDPILLKQYYQQQLNETEGVIVKTNARITQAERDNSNWILTSTAKEGVQEIYRTPLVINATYAASNVIHQLFKLDKIELQHEIAEIALLHSPILKDIGLTIMDGQFGSVMPYGLSGLHSLSSVAYTHHELSKAQLPTFSCQAQHPTCQPQQPANCNYCSVRPASNFNKMRQQIQQYFTTDVAFNYYQSLFTIKAKLRANSIDDGRPTEIRQLSAKPDFYCIFAGKVQSIYEIEKVF